MSLSTVLKEFEGDVEVSAIPSLITFLTALQTNSKQPLALQLPGAALAWAQLQENLLAGVPSLESTIVTQINAALQAKLQAQLTAAQTPAA